MSSSNQPNGNSYTVHHSAGGRGEGGFGWWVGLTRPGLAPEEWGPYDNLTERQAIRQAHRDAGLPEPDLGDGGQQ